MNANEQKPGQQNQVASKTGRRSRRSGWPRRPAGRRRPAEARSAGAEARARWPTGWSRPGRQARSTVSPGLCTPPPTSVGGFFARMRDLDVRAHEQRLTEKDPQTCRTSSGLKGANQRSEISRLCPSFGSGADRAADAALSERYVSASDRYGDAAFVPRKAKHVRFLQRSAFF